jgi:hypothetical protein
MDEIFKANVENCEAISNYIKQIQNILIQMCEKMCEMDLKYTYEEIHKYKRI